MSARLDRLNYAIDAVISIFFLSVRSRRRPQKESIKVAKEIRVLTVGELAEYLRVHRSTIYRLLKKGLLPAFKIGSDWRFNTEAIEQWRLRQSTAPFEQSRIGQ